MSLNFELARNADWRPHAVGDRPPLPEVLAPERHSDRPRFESTERRSEILTLLRTLYQHWRLSLVTAAVIFAVIAAVTFSMKSIYEPVARIEVDPPGEEDLSLNRSDNLDPEWIDTQVESLQADGVAIATVRQLRLDKDRDFAGHLAAKADVQSQQSDTKLTAAESAALRTLKGRLSVSRKLKGHFIEVSVGAQDPKTAALVTNSLIDVYTDQYYGARYASVMKSSEFLSRQLEDIQKKMRSSNDALADYQKSTGIAQIDGEQSTVTESLLELNRQLAQAQGDRIQLEGYLSNTSEKSRKSLPQLRDNAVTQALTRELDETEAELSQASVSYGDQHPKVQSLRSKVEQLKKQLASQEQGTVDQLQTTYAAARSREQLLIARMRDITSDMSRVAQYNSLKKEAQSNTELYNALYARVKEAAIAAASRSANIRVVDTARVLDRPTKPRRALNLAIGLLLSLLCGIVAAFTKEALDPTLQDSVDIFKCTGLQALSIVPRFSSANRKLGTGQKLQLDRPNSPEAEAVRVLYTGLMLSRAGSSVRTMLVTSSAPGDGKTTIAVNLAMTLARQGTTCVVDGDLRSKSLSNSFGLRENRGLAEIIAGAATLTEVLVDSPEVPGLSVLPAGSALENAGEVVLSSVMRDVIASLRGRFQYIVLDSPPILAYADGRALAALSDGVILVARYGVTTREVLNNSAEELRKAGVNVLGVVLNWADFSAPGYGRYGYSDYGKTGRSA